MKSNWNKEYKNSSGKSMSYMEQVVAAGADLAIVPLLAIYQFRGHVCRGANISRVCT